MPTFRVARVDDSHVFYMDDATFEADRATCFQSLAPQIPVKCLPQLMVPGAWATFTEFPWKHVFSKPDTEHVVCTDNATCKFLADMCDMHKENNPILMDKDFVDSYYDAAVKRSKESARRTLVQTARATIRKRTAAIMADLTDRLIQEDRRCRAMRSVILGAEWCVSDVATDADVDRLLARIEEHYARISELKHVEDTVFKRPRHINDE
jgi:hypothetical protein